MLESRTLKDIQELFVYIRFFASTQYDSELQEYIGKIEEKRNLINHLSSGFQKDIFIYCFDNLRYLINTQQYEYVFDFADAVHNLPDIFLREYNLEQYWNRYIEPLRTKHSQHNFAQFQKYFKGKRMPI